MRVYHKELAAGRWKEFSLAEQMSNIGSEVHRAITWLKKGDRERFEPAFERALELFDLTLADERQRRRLKEICRAREVFCGLMTEPEKFPNLEQELDSLDKYFFYFGICVRQRRHRAPSTGGNESHLDNT